MMERSVAVVSPAESSNTSRYILLLNGDREPRPPQHHHLETVNPRGGISACLVIPSEPRTQSSTNTTHDHHHHQKALHHSEPTQWLRCSTTASRSSPSSTITTATTTGDHPQTQHRIQPQQHLSAPLIGSTATNSPFTNHHRSAVATADTSTSSSSAVVSASSSSAVTGSTTPQSSPSSSSAPSSSSPTCSPIAALNGASSSQTAVQQVPPTEADYPISTNAVHTSSPSASHVVTIQISADKSSQALGSHNASSSVSLTPSPCSISFVNTFTTQTSLNESPLPVVSVVRITADTKPVDLSVANTTSGSPQPEIDHTHKSDPDTEVPTPQPPSSSIDSLVANHSSADMVVQQKTAPTASANQQDNSKNSFMYYMMASSGQCSPTSDTMDSGTCSDLESTPPPLPKKYNSKSNASHHHTHHPASNSSPSASLHSSFTDDSEESESSLCFDSLNTREANNKNTGSHIPIPPPSQLFDHHNHHKHHSASSADDVVSTASSLPDSLLRDIRDRSLKFGNDETDQDDDEVDHIGDHHRHQHLASQEAKLQLRRAPLMAGLGRKRVDIFASQHLMGADFEDDQFYTFHINERIGTTGVAVVSEEGDPDSRGSLGGATNCDDDDECFAGYKELKGLGQQSAVSTIRSSKGTVRGVKNRVRNGIATFLQMQQVGVKVSDSKCVAFMYL